MENDNLFNKWIWNNFLFNLKKINKVKFYIKIKFLLFKDLYVKYLYFIMWKKFVDKKVNIYWEKLKDK